MEEYMIVDFQGYVCWARCDEGKYAVDPEYLNKFISFFPKATEISAF